jgi:hypothetical protein
MAPLVQTWISVAKRLAADEPEAVHPHHPRQRREVALEIIERGVLLRHVRRKMTALVATVVAVLRHVVFDLKAADLAAIDADDRHVTPRHDAGHVDVDVRDPPPARARASAAMRSRRPAR